MGLWVICWIIFGAIGAAFGARKGKPWMGLALGVLLGIFGVIIMIFIKPDHDYLVKQERARIALEAEARAADSPTEMFAAYTDSHN
jgi:hypothetical protein